MSSRISVRCAWIVFALLSVSFATVTLVGMNFFRGSPFGMAFAGFVSSLLGFALVKFIGQIYEQRGRKAKPGKIPIAISFGVALSFAIAIHPICGLFCVVCSVPMVAYHVQAAHLVIPQSLASSHPKED